MSPPDEEPGMDFSLAPEQEEFRKVVHEFAQTVVAPKAEAMDRAERLDPDVLDQMAGMGLFGLPFAIGLPVNRDDLGMMREQINQGHGARGIRKDRVPLLKR